MVKVVCTLAQQVPLTLSPHLFDVVPHEIFRKSMDTYLSAIVTSDCPSKCSCHPICHQFVLVSSLQTSPHFPRQRLLIWPNTDTNMTNTIPLQSPFSPTTAATYIVSQTEIIAWFREKWVVTTHCHVHNPMMHNFYYTHHTRLIFLNICWSGTPYSFFRHDFPPSYQLLPTTQT